MQDIESSSININSCDNYGVSLLQRTIYDGHVTKALALIDQGADINYKNLQQFSLTALHITISHYQNTYKDLLEKLLKTWADITAKADYSNFNILHFAAENNDLDLWEILESNIKKETFLELSQAQDYRNRTPLDIKKMKNIYLSKIYRETNTSSCLSL